MPRGAAEVAVGWKAEVGGESRFGLAGGVWTKDITVGLSTANRIKSVTVWVNHYFAMDPSVPFGGYKMSGFGREGGYEHVASYLNTKSIWVRMD